MTSSEANWVKCPECKHKMFKIVDKNMTGLVQIEIKCSSCKAINKVAFFTGSDADVEYE